MYNYVLPFVAPTGAILCTGIYGAHDSAMSRMAESCHRWICRVIYISVRSVCHLLHESWCMSHVVTSRWMSHIVTSHWHVAWVMSWCHIVACVISSRYVRTSRKCHVVTLRANEVLHHVVMLRVHGGIWMVTYVTIHMWPIHMHGLYE